ncbi:hypothetical protein [Methanosalsum natronophilum]|uniref:Uncharacterized protein n=1 Tax=Methanosalsum natronophilum TaxID=768733 RepID=A0A424YXT4_9EURY|nr:hypothetical protein [Methanosalsum natronophilum]MCS3923229.1 hypothetical protein [Methanosalsum natronophilum]RQD85241.1 MAG: hypothetical protein D5R95_05135 [Methanosalsum natronophilum]
MEKYCIDDFESINSILSSFATDMFDGITFIVRPVVGGIDYLRSMHKSYLFEKEINKISNFDFQTREKILDVLTDIVVDRIYDKDFIEVLEKKISELNEIEDSFKELDHRRLNIEQKQMHHVLKISLRKLNGRIVSIRDEINFKIWEDNENISQLLILDQIFYLIQEMIKAALNTPPNKLINSTIWNELIFSLLYIEAFHRNKVSFLELNNFLSGLTLYNYSEGKNPTEKDAIFEALVV